MLHMGIDLHKSYSYVVVLDDRGEVVDQRRLNNEEVANYTSGLGKPIRATFEATRNWQYMYDQLEGRVEELLMAHPKKVKAIASARIKTDKIDAKILANLLRVDLLPTAYTPSRDIRDIRDLVRYRYRLVRQRTQVKNRIHCMLVGYPITPPAGDLFAKRGVKFLESVPLRSCHRFALDGDLALLAMLNSSIKEADQRVVQEVKANRTAKLLTTIPGIGNVTALTLMAEIGAMERFPSPKQLCSYAGLVPSTRSSGDKTHHGSITKEGSTWLRMAIVEAAQSTVRYSPYFHRYHAQLAFRQGKNAAKVAAARKILTIAFWMVKRNEPYREKCAQKTS